MLPCPLSFLSFFILQNNIEMKLPNHFPKDQCFIKGPLSREWLIKADKAGPSCLVVALDILSLAPMFNGGWVVANSSHLPHLSRWTFYRSLDALEKAKLITTKREPGQAVRVKLRDSPWLKQLPAKIPRIGGLSPDGRRMGPPGSSGPSVDEIHFH
jgi:hypothetical protein